MSERFPIHGFEDCFGPVELLLQVLSEIWPRVFQNDLMVVVIVSRFRIPSVGMRGPTVASAVVAVDHLRAVVAMR
jgi:hypothetical protein